jgi:hypothetical protein
MKTVIGKAVNYLDLKNTDIEFIDCSKTYVQKLTHQSINARFVTIKLANKPDSTNRLIWVTKNNLGNMLFRKSLIAIFLYPLQKVYKSLFQDNGGIH